MQPGFSLIRSSGAKLLVKKSVGTFHLGKKYRVISDCIYINKPIDLNTRNDPNAQHYFEVHIIQQGSLESKVSVQISP